MSATWTMKNGEKIKVEDMGHSHVVNCLNLMARRYPEYFSKFQTSVTKHTEVECKRALTKLLTMAEEINEESRNDWEYQMEDSLCWDMYWAKKD
jgi:hypothetical protein